ncbi:hypothetical protein [Microvirga roseola]|uniref:hypothetical protein n=1 Tax=Microvirga roseola TaxID=2883126 RepID=UPI001E5B9DD9|nr:hypothetical protein [Microvirga roseola]
MIPRILSCLTVSIALFVPALSAAHAQDLGGWRALTAEEEKARIAGVPSDSVDPAMVEADFDGDGTTDKGLIAVRQSDGARGLIAVLKGKVHVIDPDGIEPSDGLGLAEPGTWETVCGNAFREFHQAACEEGYPARVTLKKPGILWIGNGQTVLYFWNEKAGRFAGAAMVD